jgi:hypothetical protein
MRRRRKVRYTVEVPGLWWSRSDNRWMAIDEGIQKNVGLSSHRGFNTANRAFAHADGLMQKGYLVSIMRIMRVKSNVIAQEFANCDWADPETENCNLRTYKSYHG